MEVKVNHERKLAVIWLTRTEQEDTAVQEQLRQQYRFYKEKNYMVAQFHSGTENLYGLTRDLLLYNRKRSAQREVQRENHVERPNLSGSYFVGVRVQC